MSVIRGIAATTVPGQRRGLLTRVARSPRGEAFVTRPATARGERVLVEDVDDGSRAVLATSHGLYRDSGAGWHRWGWEAVRRVDWAAAGRALTVHPMVAPPAVLRLRRGDRLAAFAAERVAAGRLVDTWVVLADGRRAHVVGRCQPGADRPVWFVTLPDGPSDAGTDALVTLAVAAVRRQHGLP